MNAIEVICTKSFFHAGIQYSNNQVVYFDKRTAVELIHRGMVSAGNILDNIQSKTKAQVPTLVIDVKPVDITGSFYK